MVLSFPFEPLKHVIYSIFVLIPFKIHSKFQFFHQVQVKALWQKFVGPYPRSQALHRRRKNTVVFSVWSWEKIVPTIRKERIVYFKLMKQLILLYTFIYFYNMVLYYVRYFLKFL